MYLNPAWPISILCETTVIQSADQVGAFLNPLHLTGHLGGGIIQKVDSQEAV